MPKINREEYEVLKGLDDKWKWIIRNDEWALEVRKNKPYKEGHIWSKEITDHSFSNDIDFELFQFIEWNDIGGHEEPHNIQELIEEYEIKELRLAPSGTVIVDSFEESEETEVKKDFEWLRNRIVKEMKMLAESYTNGLETCEERVYNDGKDKAFTRVLRMLDQLDEPEVLSQEWVDEHSYHEDGYEFYYIDPDELKNLLVPKQEEITEEQAWEVLSELYDIPNKSYIREAMRVVANYVGDDMTIGELERKFSKPVIPKFVADWYESEGKYSSWWNWFYKWGRDEASTKLESKVINWMQDYNEKKFVDMFLHGFTVEAEQKYYVRLGEKMYFAGWYETDATFVFDDSPNSLERAKTYNLKDGKEKVKELGTGELVLVEELEE